MSLEVLFSDVAKERIDDESMTDAVSARTKAAKIFGRAIRVFNDDSEKDEYFGDLLKDLGKRVDFDISRGSVKDAYSINVRRKGIVCETQGSSSARYVESTVADEFMPISFSDDGEICYVDDITAVSSSTGMEFEL